MVACIISLRGQREASSKTSPPLRTNCKKSGVFPSVLAESSWGEIVCITCHFIFPQKMAWVRSSSMWKTFNVAFFRSFFLRGCGGGVRSCGPLQNNLQHEYWQDFLLFQFRFCLRTKIYNLLCIFPLKLSLGQWQKSFGLYQDKLKKLEQVIF